MTARTIDSDGVDELQKALADDAGFESWYRRSLPRVYSYLVSRSGGDVALAEDLTQQTFTAAIDQRSRYRRPVGHDHLAVRHRPPQAR